MYATIIKNKIVRDFIYLPIFYFVFIWRRYKSYKQNTFVNFKNFFYVIITNLYTVVVLMENEIFLILFDLTVTLSQWLNESFLRIPLWERQGLSHITRKTREPFKPDNLNGRRNKNVLCRLVIRFVCYSKKANYEGFKRSKKIISSPWLNHIILQHKAKLFEILYYKCNYAVFKSK